MLWSLIKWIFSLTRQRGIYGSARWLKGFSKWHLLNRWNKGFILDGKKSRLSLSKSFSHLAIIAPTGAGKTTRFVLPNILSISGVSCITTDPSGEIYEKSKHYLISQGYLVKVFNVTDIQNSLRYNPVHRCSSFTDIQKLANLLIDSTFDNSTGDVFWSESSKGLLNILLRIIVCLPEERRNLGELWRLLNLLGFRQQEVDALASQYLDETSFIEYGSFISQPEKTMSNIISSAKSAVNLFSNPDMATLVESESLHFESLRSQKTAIFLIIPENEIRHYKFLISILYTQVFDFCMKLPVHNRPYLPIFFFLDEFANIGKLPNFSTLITTLRKRKVALSLIFQDIAQLDIYGKSDASVILNGGCATRLFYPGLSFATCQELSNILGNQSVQFRESAFDRNSSGREREVARPLLAPDEIRTLKSNRAILIHGRELPVMLKTLPYFKNWTLKNRARGGRS